MQVVTLTSSMGAPPWGGGGGGGMCGRRVVCNRGFASSQDTQAAEYARAGS